MVPEKDPALLLRAFRQVETDQKLVLVGDSSHTDGYMTRLRELAAEDPRVVLVGYQYGDDLAALFAGARLFVQPSLLEGLPISLLEAAAYGLPVLASDIPPHREVLGERGSAGRLVFRAGDLADLAAGLTASLSRRPGGRAGDRQRAARGRGPALRLGRRDRPARGGLPPGPEPPSRRDAGAAHLSSRRPAGPRGRHPVIR